MGLQLAKTFEAQVILLHVIDSKTLEALNAMGLARPSEEKTSKMSSASRQTSSQRFTEDRRGKRDQD